MLETIPNTKFKAAGRASPQKGRPGRNPAAILKSENGDVNYFSTVVFIFIAVLLLAFILDRSASSPPNRSWIIVQTR